MMMCAAPFFMMFTVSFSDSRFPVLPISEWSIKWYIDFFLNATLGQSIIQSFFVSLLTATLAFFFGFPAGYWLSRIGPKSIQLVTLFTLPALVPYILFGFASISISRYVSLDRTLTAVVLAHVVVFCPVMMAISFHRCRQLDERVEYAARELGASERRVLFEVVLYQTWRSVLAGFLIVFVLSWDEYVVSWFLSGFDKTYPVYLRNMLESSISPEVSAAGSVIGITTLTLVIIAFFLLNRK